MKKFAIMLVLICPALKAGVIVSTSLSLTSLQITPSAGTLQLSLAPSVFGDVYDSLGDYNYGFDNSDDPALASASVALASINDAASVTGGPGASAASAVGIMLIGADAGTDTGNNAEIQGTFTILDPAGANAAPSPVNVTITALLNGSQSLKTDQYGVSAFSEITFALDLPDLSSGNNFLYYDNPITIGSASSAMAMMSPSLNGTASLQTNTSYSLYLELDSESYGLNAAAPEPASLAMCLFGLGALAAFRARSARRARGITSRQ